MSRFCIGCGTQLGEGDAFCPNCGTPAGAGAPPADQPVLGPADPRVQTPAAWQAQQQAQPPVSQPAYPPAGQPSFGSAAQVYPAAPAKNKKKLIIILSIAAVLIITGIILLIVLLPGGDGDKSGDSGLGGGSDSDTVTSSPEETIRRMVAAFNAPGATDQDVADVYFEYHYAKDDTIKQNAVSYTGMDAIRSYFGDDLKVTMTVTNTEALSEDKLNNAKLRLSDYCTDTESIEEITRVTVDISITGSLESMTDSSDYYCVKIGGKWYVSVSYHGYVDAQVNYGDDSDYDPDFDY